MSTVLDHVARHLRKHGKSIALKSSTINHLFPHPPIGEKQRGLFNWLMKKLGMKEIDGVSQEDQISKWCEEHGLSWYKDPDGDDIVFYRPYS